MAEPPRRPPDRRAERRLARYVRRTVRPYSAHYAGADLDDPAAVAPTDLAGVRDPGALVLRPDLGRIVRGGSPVLAARAILAKATGGMYRFNRPVIEYRFKPVHWVVADGVPIGYSAADVQRLAGYGDAWLARAGVGRGDVLLDVVPSGPAVGYWQLALGARRRGVSAIHLDTGVDPAFAERLAPTVLAGTPAGLIDVLTRLRDAGRRLGYLRTVLAVGPPLAGEARARIIALSGVPVVSAWAPAGVRAVWSECREGAGSPAPARYHAWRDDLIEVGADGELLWTGIGWRGSVVLRLRTRTAATLEVGPCPACGRDGVRVVPAIDPGPAPEAPAARTPEAVLDAEPGVAVYQVEHRQVGGREETIVVFAPADGTPVVDLVRRLDRSIAPVQFVVLPADEVAARVDAAGGRRVVCR